MIQTVFLHDFSLRPQNANSTSSENSGKTPMIANNNARVAGSALKALPTAGCTKNWTSHDEQLSKPLTRP